jgi:plasmid stabilization system protein ParE
MSLPIVFLPEAQDDVDGAYAGYEQRSIGLGDRFLEALRDQLDRIQANPALYGVLHQDVRAAPLRKFPYVVYYRAEASRTLILAVQHGRRSSRAWRGRI